uniref:Putative capsid protein n=1 Tax=Sichuan mosquito virus 2 TaxID=2864012 RepID=A0A8K1HHG6_9VIRU|nr:putative capsid protein [Sichuan mosquito virus 2]
MEKKVVCPVDGRRFATRAALDQHRMAAHGALGGKRKPQGSRPRRLPSGAGPANVVAQPQRVLGKAGSDMARMSGLDRLLHVEDVMRYSSGSTVMAFTVTPSGFKRLAKGAAAFQKIAYEKLVFRVEPQISASTSGGYVAAFVADPDDVIKTLDQITSVEGSVTTKWWQGASVPARVAKRDFFTSPGLELREFSPGAFYLMVDGKATQAGSLTVFCEWSVVMHGAVLEAPPSSTKVVQMDVFVRNGHQGLWADTGNAGDARFSDKASDILGSVKAGDSYRLPYPVGLVKPNDGQFALHHWIYVQDATSVFLAVNSPADYYAAAYTIDNLVVTKNTTLEKTTASAVAGEEVVPSSSGSETTMAILEQLSKSLALLPELLAQLPGMSSDLVRKSAPFPLPSAESSQSLNDWEELQQRQ